MKHYFYADNNKKFGPFTFEELKAKRLKKSTLVWTDGMQDWVVADSIIELKEILISEPPPLPKERNTPKTSKQFDLTYEKETEATYYGILLIIVLTIIRVTGAITFETVESYNQGKVIIVIISLVLRIAVTFWVVNIAKRQNRNSTGWGWFAFFIPILALIVIGLLKKLKLKITIDGNLPTNEQVEILYTKADEFYKNERFSECIELMNAALDIDDNSHQCIILKAKVLFSNKDYVSSKNEFNLLIEKGQFISGSLYYLGNIEMALSNRDLAIDYWLKSKKEGNSKADNKLNFYYYYTNKYFLNNSELKDKLGEKIEDMFIPYGIVKYINGLPQLDNELALKKNKVQINLFENGIDIEFRKVFKSTHVAIAFYEIVEAKKLVDENCLEVVLENHSLQFNYDKKKDSENKFEPFWTRMNKQI